MGAAASIARMLPEAADAQRAKVSGPLPAVCEPLSNDKVWLSANENPDGPPRSSINAMIQAVPAGGCCHYPLTNMLRVSIRTGRDMTKFRDVVWNVYQG